MANDHSSGTVRLGCMNPPSRTNFGEDTPVLDLDQVAGLVSNNKWDSAGIYLSKQGPERKGNVLCLELWKLFLIVLHLSCSLPGWNLAGLDLARGRLWSWMFVIWRMHPRQDIHSSRFISQVTSTWQYYTSDTTPACFPLELQQTCLTNRRFLQEIAFDWKSNGKGFGISCNISGSPDKETYRIEAGACMTFKIFWQPKEIGTVRENLYVNRAGHSRLQVVLHGTALGRSQAGKVITEAEQLRSSRPCRGLRSAQGDSIENLRCVTITWHCSFDQHLQLMRSSRLPSTQLSMQWVTVSTLSCDYVGALAR